MGKRIDDLKNKTKDFFKKKDLRKTTARFDKVYSQGKQEHKTLEEISSDVLDEMNISVEEFVVGNPTMSRTFVRLDSLENMASWTYTKVNDNITNVQTLTTNFNDEKTKIWNSLNALAPQEAKTVWDSTSQSYKDVKQIIIDKAIDANRAKQLWDGGTGTIDFNNVATKVYVDEKNNIQDNNYTNLSTRVQNNEVEITNKQDKLTAGNNITITNNTISSTGGTLPTQPSFEKVTITQNLLDFNDNCKIVKSRMKDMELWANNAPYSFTPNGIHLWDKKITNMATPTADTDGANKAYVDTKQSKLIAGANITIDEATNTISSTGGGGGGTLPTQPSFQKVTITQNLIDFQNNVKINKSSREELELWGKNKPYVFGDTLDMYDKKIQNLEAPTSNKDAANKQYVDNAVANGGGGGGSTTPTKFYVLVVAGQSNAVGYGENMYDLNSPLNAPDPRIVQLGRYKSTKPGRDDVNNAGTAATGYGADFDKLRPYADCNLRLIPSVPCLDHIQNMFNFTKFKAGRNSRAGGTLGCGHYVAKLLLPHLPKDYGILIVPVARGSASFRGNAGLGTYDANRKYCSDNSLRWGKDTPLFRSMYDRTKHALELNPENKLLPIVWIQGEGDAMGDVSAIDNHYNKFKEQFELFKSYLVRDGLVNRIPQGHMDYFRWFCFGSTKWMLSAKNELDFVSMTNNPRTNRNNIALYNNYVYLQNETRNRTGSQINYFRLDIDSDGKFLSTNNEEGNGMTTATREIHFATSALQIGVPKIIYNAMCNYGHCLVSPQATLSPRYVRGKAGTVFTDGQKYVGTNNPKYSSLKDNLIIRQDFSTGNVTDNKSSTGGVIVTGGSASRFVNDTKLNRRVLQLKGNDGGSHIKYDPSTFGGTGKSYTKVITFAFQAGDFDSGMMKNLWSCDSNSNGGIIWFGNRTLSIFPIWGGADNENNGITLSNTINSNWNGGKFDYQHLVVTYNAENKTQTAYLNGVVAGSCKALTDGAITTTFIGSYNNVANLNSSARVANTRLYNRCLDADEVLGCYLEDL